MFIDTFNQFLLARFNGQQSLHFAPTGASEKHKANSINISPLCGSGMSLNSWRSIY